MRNLLVVCVLLIAVVAGVGFYRGWFVMTNERQPGSNKVDVNLTVDPDKVKSDVKDATSGK